MFEGGFGRRHGGHFDPPIEMRFVDLFMIIVAALMFVAVMLSIISAIGSGTRTDTSPYVATVELPVALLGQPYNLTLAGTGGVQPYTWSIINGNLPTGLSLDPATGVVSGTPGSAEHTQITVQLVDAEKRANRREMVIDIRAVDLQQELKSSIWLSTTLLMLPNSVASQPYTYQFVVDGGKAPYEWKLSDGELPTGVNLTPDGNLVGVPESEDSGRDFIVATTDLGGKQFAQRAHLTVLPPPISLWQKILGWLLWLCTALGVILVLWNIKVILFGTKTIVVPGSRGVFGGGDEISDEVTVIGQEQQPGQGVFGGGDEISDEGRS